MNTQFTNVANILNIEGVPTNEEGQVGLSVEQLQAIENAVADLNARLAEATESTTNLGETLETLNAQIEEYQAQIDALNAQPGATTIDGVVENTTAEDTYNSSLSLFNSVKSII